MAASKRKGKGGKKNTSVIGAGAERSERLPFYRLMLRLLNTPPPPPPPLNCIGSVFGPLVVEVFIMTFLAEWGDKSQLSTIGLAAQEALWGVALGGSLGHALCTAAAVLGGRGMAVWASPRAVALFGGALFILFGILGLVTGPHDH